MLDVRRQHSCWRIAAVALLAGGFDELGVSLTFPASKGEFVLPVGGGIRSDSELCIESYCPAQQEIW
ncbi:hypothetical protein [Mycobacterium spongiae]|uniref:Uncharacterized protein n=1 Tax=Mycobacterium spongiae TaxID=886343 RepID=A0A975JWT2_9MYCO|nr:hypothetical protein [Mycobacterium spongiae]QUR67126.1 hypothetical protein F6B93_08470 [Mycobacterium spongiae]